MFRFLIIAPFSVNAKVTVADDFEADMLTPEPLEVASEAKEDATEPVSKAEEELQSENTVSEDEKKTSSDGETSTGEEHQSNADKTVSVEQTDVPIEEHKQENKSVLETYEEEAKEEFTEVAKEVKEAFGLGQNEEIAGKKEDDIASSGTTMAVNLFAFVSFILVLC